MKPTLGLEDENNRWFWGEMMCVLVYCSILKKSIVQLWWLMAAGHIALL